LRVALDITMVARNMSTFMAMIEYETQA